MKNALYFYSKALFVLKIFKMNLKMNFFFRKAIPLDNRKSEKTERNVSMQNSEFLRKAEYSLVYNDPQQLST